MENKREEILSEINSDIQAIRERLAGLEEKFALLRDELGGKLPDGQVFDLDVDTEVFTDDILNIDEEVDTQEVPTIHENISETEYPEPDDDDIPAVFDAETECGKYSDEEAVPDEENETTGEDRNETGNQSDDVFFRDEIFEPVEEPVRIINDAAGVAPAVIDNMMVRQAWRTDMAGSHVNDVRSAISLNDRVLFINSLCNENALEFTELVAEINKCGSFDEALEYISSTHPLWNYDSDVVYRFMMAVRRKFN